MTIKNKIHEKILDILNERIESSKEAIQSAEESKQNETKSSAGDKFETGRAMMQREQEMNEMQLQKTLDLKNVLGTLDLKREYQKVAPGCLVMTDQGMYFISIGIGRIKINENTYYAISLNSPIGKLMSHKEVGEKIRFQDKEIRILEIH